MCYLRHGMHVVSVQSTGLSHANVEKITDAFTDSRPGGRTSDANGWLAQWEQRFAHSTVSHASLLYTNSLLYCLLLASRPFLPLTVLYCTVLLLPPLLHQVQSSLAHAPWVQRQKTTTPASALTSGHIACGLNGSNPASIYPLQPALRLRLRLLACLLHCQPADLT
jgi:hypothetical protein